MAEPTVERWRVLVVALATVAALLLFVFENPNSPGAATEVAAAGAPERVSEMAEVVLVIAEPAPDPAPATRVERQESVALVPAMPQVADLGYDERLEAEERAAEERRFEEEALAAAAAIAEEEYQTSDAVEMFLAAKQAEASRQALRARLRAEEEDRRAEAIATPGPTTTIPSDTEPDEAGPSPEQWEALRFCESSGNYGAISPTGNYRGAYQFSLQTWDWIAGIYHERLVGVDPATAAPADQDAMAQSLYDLRGRGQWPVCGRYLP